MLALSFPRFGHAGVAWIALAPLLVALVDGRREPWAKPVTPVWRALGLGLTTGAVYFAGTLYWSADVMKTFGGLSYPIAAAVNLILVAYLALFPALFAVAMAILTAAFGRSMVLIAPAVWVTAEWGRGWVLGGFPWVLLGYSQATVLPIAQAASLFGVYGLSALVSFVSAALAHGAVGRGRGRLGSALAALVIVAATAAWGSARIGRGSLAHEGTPVRVGLIQGNIAQDQKWDVAHAVTIFETYLEMSREAARRGARFVIWPESATPFYFEQDRAGGDAIRRLARETRTTLLFGSDQVEPGQPPQYYNAAFLVGPDGETRATYRKIHLVPFGEYVPLKRLLFFAAPLVESVADFSPGDAAVMLPVEGHLASTAICYEVVYPELIRRFVVAGSELLTTVTNDAWYGRSSAPHQHFEQAALRAIEEGRFLVRAANTGISGIVDPYGRVVVRSNLFERTSLVGEARFLTGRTVYSRIGDLLAYVCLALTVVALVAARGGKAGKLVDGRWSIVKGRWSRGTRERRGGDGGNRRRRHGGSARGIDSAVPGAGPAVVRTPRVSLTRCTLPTN